MQHRLASSLASVLLLTLASGLGAGIGPSAARAEALLLVEASTGKVLHASNATYPWYPASVTKLMTTYVTLRAVKDGRIALDRLLTVSENALAQQPSKMGFPVGTQVTVDNALKMLMVKSANDMAVVLAEGVSGSVEGFAEEMNKASVKLGMTQSSWVNPNGLPAEMQVTSARDMAILARALMRDFPEHELYWRISSIKFGRRVMRNYNKLIDRYPGADGMKTGFICASGYNLVASATRNGRRLIAVVLGSPSGMQRAETAAGLLERGFNTGGLSWLLPTGTVDSLPPMAAEPPNLREEICGRNRGKIRTDHAEEEEQQPVAGRETDSASAAFAAIMPSFRSTALNGEKVSLLGNYTPQMPPIPVSVIPPRGAPADPDALMAKRKKPTFVARAKGRKQAVISIAAPEAGAEATKEKPAAAAKPKPAAAPKAAAKKPAAPAKPAKPSAARPKPVASSTAAAPAPTRAR